MPVRTAIYQVFLSILCLLFISGPAAAARIVRVEGLKVTSASELFRALNINGGHTSSATDETVRAIEDYYRKKGYSLVKVHLVSETDEEIALFVDEGKIAKIVVHERNNYYALKYRQTIKIPARIYNRDVIERNVNELKKKYGFSAVRVELEKIPDYDKNVFQINRELNSITLFNMKLQIFSKYPAEYEVHFYFDYGGGKVGPGVHRDGWGFNIDYNYPSVFIPQAGIYRSGLFGGGDYFETEFSAGFDPGIGGLISLPPHNTLKFPPDWTFSMIESEYRFFPLRQTVFTPVIRGRIYHSAGGRPDLGYSSFKYVSLRATVAPGITPLEDLNIYAGLGCESDRFYDLEEDPSAEWHDGVTETWEHYPYIEMRVAFDPIPFRPGIRAEKNFTLTYTHYYNGTEFRELDISGARGIEFSNLSVLSFRLWAVLNSSSAPFHHHAPVNNSSFKGFSSLGYYANRLFAFSSEYRFSIYRDYIYTGIFCDWTVFRPEGMIISGVKNGIVAGPTVRFLIYDQFELIVYAGWDRLFPDGSGQKNIKARLARIW